MSEGVVSATVEEAKRHPWLIGGGVVGLVILLWFMSGSSSSKPQNFTFSYGPSDTTIKANTALAMQQAQDQTQVSLASTQAGIYGDYFDYLANSGKANNTAAIQLAKIQSDTSNYAVNMNDQTALKISGINAGTAQAATAAQLAATIHGQDTALQTVNLNTAAANYQAGLTATTQRYSIDQTATTQRYTAGLTAQTTQASAYYGSQTAMAQSYYQNHAQEVQAMYSAQTAQAGYGAQTAQQATQLAYQQQAQRDAYFMQVYG